MLQAGVDRFDVNDTAGAKARFDAVHGADAATAEQKGYAAYYLASLAWQANDYDTARTLYQEARDNADSHTAELATSLLRTHCGD
jgi:hypothetical protein